MLWGMMCCCAKTRKGEEESSLGDLDSKLKSTSKILIEFVTEESKIGLKETPCLDLVEQILIAATNQKGDPKEGDDPDLQATAVLKSIYNEDLPDPGLLLYR